MLFGLGLVVVGSWHLQVFAATNCVVKIAECSLSTGSMRSFNGQGWVCMCVVGAHLHLANGYIIVVVEVFVVLYQWGHH